ncbi:hypothetical protein RJ639_001121 [Escallonia herrerae]|uniref:Uncharacterized protein n=1 Tax=Escallonia herrerae TaxID=1293975 RepID=A0AA88XHJ0_9ASTE|nr:hypothetical protein RJ639_001121 [Escallonia herrerae]
MDRTPHVALYPSPGMGHLIPPVELAKQLAHHHSFSATIIVPTTGQPTKSQKAVLNALPNAINHLFLPPVDLPENINPEVQIFLILSLSLSSLRDALESLLATTRLVALVVDPFSIDAFDVAKKLHVSPYLFFTSSAMCLSFSLSLPKLDEEVSCEFRDLPEPVEIPGSVPVHGRDLLDPVQDRSGEPYKKILHNVKRFNLAEGLIVNSFMELEGGAIRALQGEEPDRPPVYVIGPLIGSTHEPERSECLQWLDSQPGGSVLFVSFGSGGTLSYDQINELALGLEMSGQREEIGKVVNDLMKGEEGIRLRKKMKELKDAGTNALSKNGSSSKSLSRLAIKLKNQNNKSEDVQVVDGAGVEGIAGREASGGEDAGELVGEDGDAGVGAAGDEAEGLGGLGEAAAELTLRPISSATE